MVVRVYRTDKFRYNVDQKDAKVTFAGATLQKLKKTEKDRTTPGMDDTSIYTLLNDTRSKAADGDAFMVLQKLDKGLYEIVFRALYSDFPLTVESGRDHSWWISQSLQSFYYVQPDGHMIIVRNITGINRDFNSTTSNYTTFDISASLRNSSQPNSEIGIIRPNIIDNDQIVAINYGSSALPTCNDGSAIFQYSDSSLTFIGDQATNFGSWIDTSRKWWVTTSSNSVRVINYENSQILFDHTFTPTQLAKIVSRYSLGSWLGPLVALASLWITITIFCAIACRSRC